MGELQIKKTAIFYDMVIVGSVAVGGTAYVFYTSQIGIKDVDYVGNAPNKWEGISNNVLVQYNLKGF